MSALREEFPRIKFAAQLFAIDRDRYTCSGGIAPLDLMLNMIKDDLGPDIAPLISEQFILDRIRNDRDRQHIPLQAQVGVFHERLIKAAALMEANIEEPMSLDDLAASIGVSRRQIERLFKRHLDQVPTKYYLEIRLRRARELLLQTSMSIMDITTACGFQSPPHFSKCYRNAFGYPPSAERQMNRAGRGAARHFPGGSTEVFDREPRPQRVFLPRELAGGVAQPRAEARSTTSSSSAGEGTASPPPTTSPRSTASPTSPCWRRAGSAAATPAATRRSCAPTTCGTSRRISTRSR